MAYNPNYGILTQGSANLANATSGLGQSIGQGLESVAQGYMQGQQNQAQQQQQLQEQVKQQEMENTLKSASQGDTDAMERLWGDNPEMAMMFEERKASQIAESGAAKAFESKKAEVDWGLRWKRAGPEQKKDLLTEALNNPLIDIDGDDVGIEGDEADLAVNSMLYGHLGKDAYKDLGIGPEASGAISSADEGFKDLIKDFTPEQQKTARLVRAGLTGRAISNAELSAIKSGEIKDYSDYKIKQKQAEKFAELTGSSRAKAIDAGFDRIQKIDVGMKNIDKAITLLTDGAGVGAIEKWLPSIKASTVALNNLQSTMALDVIGAVTFGALSQGELDLAKNVALNTKLDTPELIADLKARKAAQEKLRAYFNEQIQHLDQGGTKASFLRKKEREMNEPTDNGAEDQEQAPQAALQMLQQNPAMREQFKAKYGYLPEGM